MICDKCGKQADVIAYKIHGRLVAVCTECEVAMEKHVKNRKAKKAGGYQQEFEL